MIPFNLLCVNTIARLLMLLIIDLDPCGGTPFDTTSVQGRELQIAFLWHNTGDDHRSPLEKPDQSAAGRPVSITSFTNAKVTLKISAITAVYEVILSSNEITGTPSRRSFPPLLNKRI
jgi:hypothetical protein